MQSNTQNFDQETSQIDGRITFTLIFKQKDVKVYTRFKWLWVLAIS